jgi:hypothetical protein
MPASELEPKTLRTTRLIAIAAAGVLFLTSAIASSRSSCTQDPIAASFPAPFGQALPQAELSLLAAARWASAPAAAASPAGTLEHAPDPALSDSALDAGLRERIARYQLSPAEAESNTWSTRAIVAELQRALELDDRQVAVDEQCGWDD